MMTKLSLFKKYFITADENQINCLLFIFLRLNGIAKIKNAKIKILRFGAQIAKISNRRKYPLNGMFICLAFGIIAHN